MPRTTPRRQQPPGRSFAYWLRHAMTAARSDHGVMQREVAAALQKSERAVSDFENLKTPPHIPAEIDRFLAAYTETARAAALAEGQSPRITDPRELVQRALNLWLQKGDAPLLHPPHAGTSHAALNVEREVRQQAERADPGKKRTPTSSRKTREAG